MQFHGLTCINSIQCNGCLKWIHAPPMKKCSLLDLHQSTKYNNPENSDPWYCTYCTANILPFNNLNDTHFLLLQNELMDKVSDDLKLYPDKSFNYFTEACETIINSEDNDVNDGILNHVNSKYYNIHKFNKIKPDVPSSIGFLHTNIASIYKHDDLLITLSHLKFEFHVIALTEHKIRNPYLFKILKFLDIMNSFMIPLKLLMEAQVSMFRSL